MAKPIRYNPEVLPAEGDDAVAFCADQLRESERVQTALLHPRGEEQGVYEGARPSRQEERFVLVREFRQKGGRVEQWDGRDPMQIQVVTSCPADMGQKHKRKFHRRLHARIREALEGKRFERGVTTTLKPIHRVQKPVSIGYEEETGQSRQNALYAVTLWPSNAPDPQ